jgi:hypothetical protein
VRHPNVTIFGAERIGDRVGPWMDLVRGRSLEQILDGGNVFTVADGIDVVSSAVRFLPCTGRACCIAISRPTT